MQKNDPKMTNLKAGSGSTVMPVQGPQICPILGDFWWPSNRRFVDPEPSLKGLRSAERSVFFFKKGPRTDFAQGVKCGPQTDCPAYIYIYIATSQVLGPHFSLFGLKLLVLRVSAWSFGFVFKGVLGIGGLKARIGDWMV